MPVISPSPMLRHGHQLDYKRVGDEMIGTCECGVWCVVLPAPAGADVLTVIAQVLRQHEEHVDMIANPTTDDQQP